MIEYNAIRLKSHRVDLLGGRLLAEKYTLNLPDYPGFAQIVELPSNSAL